MDYNQPVAMAVLLGGISAAAWYSPCRGSKGKKGAENAYLLGEFSGMSSISFIPTCNIVQCR